MVQSTDIVKYVGCLARRHSNAKPLLSSFRQMTLEDLF